MADNMIMRDGRKPNLAVGSGVSAGDPVAVGQITGVAMNDADSSNKSPVDRGGVYDLSVKAIDGSGNSAVAIGEKLYYVSGDTPKISKKDTGVFFGWALEAIASGQTDTINVLQGGGEQ